jgi:ABC-type Fe3+ transport system permease subunit
MKQLVISLLRLTAILVVPLTLSLTAQAYAASGIDVLPLCDPNNSSKTDASNTDVCQSVPNHGTPGENPIIHALSVTISILAIIIGITAVIMVIVGGLSFVTANGDPQAIARARSSIIYALIGIVIAAIAELLVQFVLNKV